MNKLLFTAALLAFVALALLGGVYAQWATYQSFAEGPRADGRIEAVILNTLTVSYTDENNQSYSSVYSEPLSESAMSSFKVGDRVRIAHHVGNPMRVMPESELTQLKASPAYLRTVKSVGLAALLCFVWAIVQSIRRRRLKTGWDIILWSLSRTRNVSVGIGLLILAFGGFVFWLAWFDPQQVKDLQGLPAWQITGMKWGLTLFGTVCCYLGGWGFLRGVKMLSIKKSPLYEKLTTRYSEIVWIYESTAATEHAEAGKEYYVMVGFLDGSLEQISVEKAHVAIVIQSLAQKVPQARTGYSKALADLFQQNPSAVQLGVL